MTRPKSNRAAPAPEPENTTGPAARLPVSIREVRRPFAPEVRVLVPVDGAIKSIAFFGAVYFPRFVFTIGGTFGGPMREVRFRAVLAGDDLPDLPPGTRAEAIGAFERRFLGLRLAPVHLFREIVAPRPPTDAELARALGLEPDARLVIETIGRLDARNAGALALLVDDRRVKVAAAARARLAQVRRPPTSKRTRAGRGRRS